MYRPGVKLVECTGQRGQASKEYKPDRNAGFQTLIPVSARPCTYLLIPPTRPLVMLGPAGRADLPRRRAGRGGASSRATSPPAGGAPRRRSLHSHATRIRRPVARHGEAGRPRWARPGRGWPDTNARAIRTTRREREGRRLQRERPPPKSKPVWPTVPPLTTTPHTADVKTSSIGAGVVPGGGEGTRRCAIKVWSRAG